MVGDVGARVVLSQVKVLFKRKKRSSPVLLPFVLVVAMLIQFMWPAQTDGPLKVTIGF